MSVDDIAIPPASAETSSASPSKTENSSGKGKARELKRGPDRRTEVFIFQVFHLIFELKLTSFQRPVTSIKKTKSDHLCGPASTGATHPCKQFYYDTCMSGPNILSINVGQARLTRPQLVETKPLIQVFQNRYATFLDRGCFLFPHFLRTHSAFLPSQPLMY